MRQASGHVETSAGQSVWSALSWDDLSRWAGPRSVSRGRSYRTAVINLAVAADGSLLAWIEGTERYATVVKVAKSKSKAGTLKLSSQCTCPVGISCKHAVAVVVAYLHALKHAQAVAKAAKDDPRWEEIEGRDRAPTNDHDERPPTATSRAAALRPFLAKKTQVGLLDLLIEILKRNPEELERLQEARDLGRGAVALLVSQAQSELMSVTAEPAWTDRWRGGGSLPDYTNLRRRFENLLAAGATDALVGLGIELLRRGTQQVEASHDEGMTAGEIGGCMQIVFEALLSSKRSDAEKVQFTIESLLEDQYDLCQGASRVLSREWSQPVWSTVAESLRARLSGLQLPAGSRDFTASYRRDQLVEQIADLLERAGRAAEILPLYQEEARRGGSYTRLVKHLIGQKRLDEAAASAVEGIDRAATEDAGIRDQLRGLLRQIAEAKNDKAQVAAWAASDFFRRPALTAYHDLTKAARAAGCGPAVKEAALRFLQTGVLPAGASTPDRQGGWPLPAISLLPGAPAPVQRRLKPTPPASHHDVLLELAFHERAPEDVLRWYDLLRAPRQNAWGRWGSSSLAVRVADAVADAYPDRALALWRAAAESEIAQTSPAAYEVAAKHLEKYRARLGKLGRDAEWTALAAALRAANLRKRKFIEILDRLEGRRRTIIEG